MQGAEVEHEKPRVLITGATGFLGKYAVNEFDSSGYEVIATGRNAANLEDLDQKGIAVVRTDLAELPDLNLPVDYVVHAAAFSSPWGKLKDFTKHNVEGTRSVIEFCANNGARRLVYVSSPSIYSANYDRIGIKEEDFDPDNNLNHYIQSKIRSEQLLHRAHSSGLLRELTILRPRGLIGVGDPSIMPRLLRANMRTGIPLFNDGSNVVDLTCVENAARAIRLSIEQPSVDGMTFNITNDEPRTFRSLIEEFFAVIGKEPHFRSANTRAMYAAALILEKACAILPSYPEPPLTRYMVSTLAFSQTLDISTAKQYLSYKPSLSLSDGIRNYAAHIRSNHVA